MTDDIKKFSTLSRRGFLKASVAGAVAASAPMFFINNAHAYANAPKGKTVTLGLAGVGLATVAFFTGFKEDDRKVDSVDTSSFSPSGRTEQ